MPKLTFPDSEAVRAAVVAVFEFPEIKMLIAPRRVVVRAPPVNVLLFPWTMAEGLELPLATIE